MDSRTSKRSKLDQDLKDCGLLDDTSSPTLLTACGLESSKEVSAAVLCAKMCAILETNKVQYKEAKIQLS
jgi:hypothetical protein